MCVTSSARAEVFDHQWCEVRTLDFHLLSDLPPTRARELAASLARFKTVARTFVPREHSPEPPPLKVIVFRRSRDFRRVFNLRRVAGFMMPALEQHILVFGPNGPERYLTRTAFHEYTHYLLRSRQGLNYPIWYEEGFASFLSTLRFTQTGVVVGDIPNRSFIDIAFRKLTVPDVVSERYNLDWGRHDLPRLYEKSWLLVHMLHLGHATGLPAYHENVPEMLALIDAGASTRRAMTQALGASPEELDRQIRTYQKHRSIPSKTLRIETANSEILHQRCLEETEVQYELAIAAITHNRDYSLELFELVLAANPDDVAALVGLSRADADVARARDVAAQALSIDADHPGANVRMAELRISECLGKTSDECVNAWTDSARHYRRALRDHPDSVDAAYGLGIVYLHTGQSGDAVNYLRVAYQRAPWAPKINYYLGEAYRLTGDKARARIHLTKAMNWHPDERWRERAALALAMIGS